MPRLIVLNGPPACGKSTLAERYVADHPLALNLDIDRVRRLLGGWKADPLTAGLLARSIALSAARTHLSGGHDVVVSQYLGRVEYLTRLAEVATETGADYHEIVLMDTKDRLLARFAARTAAAADPAHLDAQEILDRFGGTRQLEAMYDRLLLVIAARPHGLVVPAPEGEIDATYRDLLSRLDG
ncbi:MAG: AAA family ATPase [Sciscionella sp.]